jgi:Nif-specific regulatory protein
MRIIHATAAAQRAVRGAEGAALPESLIERALRCRIRPFDRAVPVEGKIGAADHGTLLLDDVGELPLAAQAKLLQFLQSKQYYRLGSARTTTADVRVVAATNADLRTAVAERRFREDLLYRLEVLPICVPTLAERAGDVELMAEYFATARFAAIVCEC